jgi:hypothetical protein
MKQPCQRECPGRSPTCHAECVRWAEWEEWKREEYARREVRYHADIHGAAQAQAVRRALKHAICRPGKSGKY